MTEHPPSQAEGRRVANLIRASYWTPLVIPSPSGVEVAIFVDIDCYYNNRESLAEH
jgi:hypothetical protein